MRELAYGARQSGRTTTLVMTMVEEMTMHDKKVFIVVSRYCLGMELRDLVRKYNGDPSRVQVVALESLHTLRGLDPRNIYIEHTAYEQANRKQLDNLYMLEDLKDAYIWGN